MSRLEGAFRQYYHPPGWRLALEEGLRARERDVLRACDHRWSKDHKRPDWDQCGICFAIKNDGRKLAPRRWYPLGRQYSCRLVAKKSVILRLSEDPSTGELVVTTSR
jgi:hypothetical protein